MDQNRVAKEGIDGQFFFFVVRYQEVILVLQLFLLYLFKVVHRICVISKINDPTRKRFVSLVKRKNLGVRIKRSVY